MKTIGLLGGMSWESTALYYRLINEATRQARGGLHSAPIALVSVDFQKIEDFQQREDWAAAGAFLAEKARLVQAGGADFLLLCTNTMHKTAAAIAAAIDIPLLHLADAAARRVKEAGIDAVGLLGTRFTMEQDFYKSRLEQQGLQVLVPDAADRAVIHRVIYQELCQGVVREPSRAKYLEVIERLGAAGAQGVIEGCTEIGMLVQQRHTSLPLFDTTAIHARAAVDKALGKE